MTEYDKKWNRQYEQLVEYKRKKGDCMVPRKKNKEDLSLAIWVRTQRQNHDDNMLRLDRKRSLDEIGFAWKDDGGGRKPDDKLWHQHYEKLVEFKRINGDCMVPKNYEQNRSLGRWVARQRSYHDNNELALDRMKILDELGFDWKGESHCNFNQNDKLWHQQYEKLLEFKRINGNCMVPKSYEQDKSLGWWVARQRSYHGNNKMRPDRKIILDEIGFAWKADADHTFKPDDKLWQQQYEKLVEYKRKYGHCKVPQTKSKDEKSLGVWVRNQRARHAKMLPDRKELLDALDFVSKAKNRSECPSPNIKRPSTSLVGSGGIGARRNQRGKATGSSSAVEENGGGRDEDDSKPCLVTSSAARIGSSPGQEAVQEQVATLGDIPYGWTRVKLEPDC
jgi:hypothetical protein